MLHNTELYFFWLIICLKLQKGYHKRHTVVSCSLGYNDNSETDIGMKQLQKRKIDVLGTLL